MEDKEIPISDEIEEQIELEKLDAELNKVEPVFCANCMFFKKEGIYYQHGYDQCLEPSVQRYDMDFKHKWSVAINAKDINKNNNCTLFKEKPPKKSWFLRMVMSFLS